MYPLTVHVPYIYAGFFKVFACLQIVWRAINEKLERMRKK
jgi:hypothetical protein